MARLPIRASSMVKGPTMLGYVLSGQNGAFRSILGLLWVRGHVSGPLTSIVLDAITTHGEGLHNQLRKRTRTIKLMFSPRTNSGR